MLPNWKRPLANMQPLKNSVQTLIRQNCMPRERIYARRRPLMQSNASRLLTEKSLILW